MSTKFVKLALLAGMAAMIHPEGVAAVEAMPDVPPATEGGKPTPCCRVVLETGDKYLVTGPAADAVADFPGIAFVELCQSDGRALYVHPEGVSAVEERDETAVPAGGKKAGPCSRVVLDTHDKYIVCGSAAEVAGRFT